MVPLLLVVEDDPLQREVIKHLLEAGWAGGVSVAEAIDLASALAWLERRTADAVLLDLGLPDAYGVTAVEAMRRAAPSTPLVVVTAREDDDAAAAIAAGAQDFVNKSGITADGLARTIRHAIERNRAETLERARLRAIVAAQQAIALLPLDRDDGLMVVADHARLLAGADGATVDVLERDELVVRGASGACAHLLGQRVGDADGVAALALRTATPQSAGAGLGESVAAALCVPLLRDAGGPVGVVEVVSGRADAFDDRDLSALQVVAGAVAAHLGLVADVREIQRLVDELSAANADLTEFAYVAAHDLKSPLVVISGFAELLRDRLTDADPEVRQWLGAIEGGAGRMSTLVDDLLAYCRVGTSAQVADEVDLDALCRRVTADLGLDSVVRIETALPTVVGDRGMLGQLLQNLISNGAKFVAPGTTPLVRVRAEQEAAGWRVSVVDNGIGIPADDRERAFGMFTRLRAKAEYPGTGIGLAICRRVVERHGGTITIGDTPGGGTTITFTLPDS